MMYRTISYAEGTFDVFWYEKNLQGDIVAIYNSSGTKLVTYDYYDAWGNYTVSYSNNGATTGAQYNPFRYRGYYYDTDLGMYYLQSRYYDAKICRFINADIYVSTGQGIIGFNMFAYCRNQVTTKMDDEGTVDETCISDDDDLLDESWQDGKGAGGGAGPATSGSGYNGYSGGYTSAKSPTTTSGSRSSLRSNMLKEGNPPGEGYQAHHGLPWKYKDYFNSAGIDINDSSYGRWVRGGGNGGHQSWSYRYNKIWDTYINNHPIADSSDIIDYFNRLNGKR